MTALQQYIASYFGVTTQHLDTVADLFTQSRLTKGSYFVKQGQYCEQLSFVQSGCIRIYAAANNKEVTQWIATQGHFLTELYSFSFQQRARWNIQALTDCELYTINKENYALLNERVPNWAAIEKQFMASCFVQLEERVFRHLSLSAEERYDKLFEENKALFNQVPLQYIASMLGMSAETFSRIRQKKVS